MRKIYTKEENSLPLDFREVDISRILFKRQDRKKDLEQDDHHYKSLHIYDHDYKELNVYKAYHAKSGIICVLGYWKEESKIFLCLNKEGNSLIEVPTRYLLEKEEIT